MDIAEALTKPGVPNNANQHMVNQRSDSVGSIGELLEYEDIQTEMKLEDCVLVEVEMGKRGGCMTYVKNGGAGWTPVVRKKSAWSEVCDNCGDLNVRLNLIEGRSLVRYRKVNGVPRI